MERKKIVKMEKKKENSKLMYFCFVFPQGHNYYYSASRLSGHTAPPNWPYHLASSSPASDNHILFYFEWIYWSITRIFLINNMDPRQFEHTVSYSLRLWVLSRFHNRNGDPASGWSHRFHSIGLWIILGFFCVRSLKYNNGYALLIVLCIGWWWLLLWNRS